MSGHDELCPAAEISGSGCLCLWIRDARADDERERIAHAIEVSEFLITRTLAADIARNGGSEASPQDIHRMRIARGLTSGSASRRSY